VYGIHDKRFIGHSPACPTRFAWVTTEDQLYAQRIILMILRETLTRLSSDPEWLLLECPDWRPIVEQWERGLTNVAIASRWEDY
jgi:hypothetical protein